MATSESSKVLSLVERKFKEKEAIIREQMEQITTLEEAVAEHKKRSDQLSKKIDELEAANAEYRDLKSQLQSLLGE